MDVLTGKQRAYYTDFRAKNKFHVSIKLVLYKNKNDGGIAMKKYLALLLAVLMVLTALA